MRRIEVDFGLKISDVSPAEPGPLLESLARLSRNGSTRSSRMSSQNADANCRQTHCEYLYSVCLPVQPRKDMRLSGTGFAPA